MKTYIWTHTDDWNSPTYKWDSPFQYDFMAVMAESLNDAREIAIEELSKTTNKNDIFDEFSKRCKIINITIPIILEPNTAMLIDHSNP